MIELNQSHPNYNLANEILATLAPEPVPMSVLVDDFGLKSQAELREQLKHLGCWTKTSNSFRDGRQIAINSCDWPTAKRYAQTYWQAVYGSAA